MSKSSSYCKASPAMSAGGATIIDAPFSLRLTSTVFHLQQIYIQRDVKNALNTNEMPNNLLSYAEAPDLVMRFAAMDCLFFA